MEDELVQNILSQSTYDAAYRRAQNKRNWTDTNNFQYKTGASDLISQARDIRNTSNKFFSSLSGHQLEIPSIESSMERASQSWALRDATKRAEERLAKEKEARTYPTFSTSYDVTRGWRDSTEDAAKLDKYIAEELGASPEEAQQVYNDTWNNANKTLGIATAATLGTAATFGAAGGAFGPMVADITNGLFAVDAAKNLASGEGVQKTFRLARQGDWKGALKSGAWDALDLSMLGHTAGTVGRIGKSILNGRSLGNAYRSDVAGRLLKHATYREGGILKAQKGRIIKSIGKAAKTKKVELTGDLFAETPKSVFKPKSFKGYGINPEAFSGVEHLTPYTYGYNRQIPMLKAREINIPKPTIKTQSGFDSFLHKSAVEQNDIVKFWNGENFSSFEQLQRNPKEFKAFQNWWNKINKK